VQIARLGHADRRVNEDIGLCGPGGLQGDLAVQAVHGLAGVEGHHVLPALLGEQVAQFFRCVAQGLEVELDGQLDALQLAADIGVADLVVEVAHPGVVRGGGAVDLLRLALLVRLPRVLNGEHRQHEALAVAQGKPLARLDLVGLCAEDVQGDGNGPQGAIRQVQGVDNRVVDTTGHESAQGREATVQEQLEVADLAQAEVDGREVTGYGLEFSGALLVDQQVAEFAAVGGCQVIHWCYSLPSVRKAHPTWFIYLSLS
jgi:hypothetical protein